MNETKDYPCELCQGLVKCKGLIFRRIRCKKCGKLFCKHHINNHNCKNERDNKEIVENILKLLNHAEQISILFNDYTTIWISKSNKGSLYYSEDQKAWNFNISKEELIDLIKNKLGI